MQGNVEVAVHAQQVGVVSGGEGAHGQVDSFGGGGGGVCDGDGSGVEGEGVCLGVLVAVRHLAVRVSGCRTFSNSVTA